MSVRQVHIRALPGVGDSAHRVVQLGDEHRFVVIVTAESREDAAAAAEYGEGDLLPDTALVVVGPGTTATVYELEPVDAPPPPAEDAAGLREEVVLLRDLCARRALVAAAREAGWGARLAGTATSENPFEDGTPAAVAWAAGWSEAQQRVDLGEAKREIDVWRAAVVEAIARRAHGARAAADDFVGATPLWKELDDDARAAWRRLVLGWLAGAPAPSSDPAIEDAHHAAVTMAKTFSAMGLHLA